MELLVSTSDSTIHGKKYSPEQIAALPDFSVQTAEKAFKLNSKQGYVVIDNKHGLGQTPDNQNVLYKGFVAWFETNKLIDVFPKMRQRETESFEMLKLMQDGFSIGNPCLYLDIDPYVDKEEGIAKLTGHEGRARIWAMNKMGVKRIPIQILFLGYRARHVENHAEFIEWLNKGVKLEKSEKVYQNLFKDVVFG